MVKSNHLAGNLKDVSPTLLNSTGRVMFTYRRPAKGREEERLAFVSVFQLPEGPRLMVGRDIEDQRAFGRHVRQIFLWTLAGMALLGLGVSMLVNRRLLDC